MSWPVYLAMALLTVAAGVWLSRPWWSTQVLDTARRRAFNVAAYRQRLAELDTEVQAGLLTAEAAATLRDELSARVLGDAQDGGSMPVTDRRAPRAAVLLGLILAIFAVGYYYLGGSWRQPQAAAAIEHAAGADGMSGSMEEMVQGLARRLEENPADVEGWFMLGGAYFALERYADSAKAYARANELSAGQEPDALVNEGEALALSRDRDLQGRPQQLFDEALKLSPDHGKALWYAGLAALQADDRSAARAYWTRLSQQELPPQLRSVLDERLAALDDSGSVPVVSAAASGPVGSKAPPADAGAVRLELKVELSPELASKLPPAATLFVFARAEQGPPMPLAVHRGPVGRFPFEITLDDGMAMMPALKLSQFERWNVTARISRSGDVKAQSGDLQGSRVLTRADTGRRQTLVIDQVVP